MTPYVQAMLARTESISSILVIASGLASMLCLGKTGVYLKAAFLAFLEAGAATAHASIDLALSERLELARCGKGGGTDVDGDKD